MIVRQPLRSQKFTVVFLTLIFHGGHFSATFEDLLTALNTSEKIWIQQRSFTSGAGAYVHKCIYKVKLNLTTKIYKFRQYYQSGRYTYQYNLYAELHKHSEGRAGPVMRVSMYPGTPAAEYTLRYWNKEERCALYTMTLINKATCVMDIWNERIGQKFPKCYAEYYKHCREHYPVYSSDCRKE
ncbi:uncharacterized protein LOC142591299 isoform X2 [Dermacentor variabilis]|uniref:uncharacterized protein LOC142591299 isoform X2 n=1 Tax=Dermacentor variabilis TaxID=34621 RepID=UPI003F5AF532